jgi:glycogen synthase
MRILHILYQSTPNTAGSSIRSRDIIDAQLAEGLTPVVITSPFQEPLLEGAKEEVIDGIKYYRTFSGMNNELVSEKNTSFFTQIRKLLRIFLFTYSIYRISKSEKIDILHAHAMFFCALPAKIVSIFLNLPLLYEIRSLWEERYKGYSMLNKIIFSSLTFFETIAMASSNEIIAINHSLKQTLQSRFLLKDKKIHVVENAVNLNRINVKKVNRDVKVFSYIGTISPIEGLDLLTKTFVKLHEKGLKNKLVIYGDGIMLSKLRNLTKGDNLIEYRGVFKQDQIAEVYSEVDIIINPRKKSFLSDTVTPLKPLEAMGFEKLIMASNVGGMREIIKDRETGILFQSDSEDAIKLAVLDIIKNKNTINMIENAKRYVEQNRSWQYNAIKYKEIYNNFYNE